MSASNASATSAQCYSAEFNATVYFVCYQIITPIVVVFGTLAYVVTLIAFYKKKDTTYRYQVCFTVTRLLEMISNSLFILLNEYLSGQTAPSLGVEWFKKSYFLMWFAAHVTGSLSGILANVSLILSICMAADRLFAFCKPFSYKNIKHKKHQILAVLFSYLCGYIMGLETPYRYDALLDKGGEYKIVKNQFVLNNLSPFLSVFRLAARILCLLLLFTFNIVMLKYFATRSRSRNKKLSEMYYISSSEKTKKMREKVDETTLVLVVLAQSFSTALPGLILSFISIAPYVVGPYLASCVQLWNRYYFTFMLFNDVMDLYLLLLLSKPFRCIVLNVCPWYKPEEVQPMAQSLNAW